MRQKSYPNIFRYNKCFLLEPHRSNIDCVLLKNMTVLNILFAPISKENSNTAKEKGLAIFNYFFSLWNRSKSWYHKVVTNTFRQRCERTWSGVHFRKTNFLRQGLQSKTIYSRQDSHKNTTKCRL